MKEKRLLNAILNNDLARLQEALQQEVDLNVRDGSGETALMLTARCGNEEMFQLLLNREANPHLTNLKGQTALMIAAQSGQVKMTHQLLYREGIQVNQQDIWGQTALMKASENGHLAIVKALLKAGANPNITDPYGLTALMMAAENGQTEVVSTLLKAEADANLRDQFNNTAFSLAASKGRQTVMTELLDHWQFNFASELLNACECGDIITATELLRPTSGLDVNEARTANGKTPLMLAAENGHIELVNRLLNHGADVRLKDVFGWTALFYAVSGMYAHLELIQLLLQAGSNINALSEKQYSPLHTAIQSPYAKQECIHLLLESGADLNAKNNKGQTPLILATEKGREDLVDLLLQYEDVQLDEINTEGRTAFMLSVIYGRLSIARKLMARKVNLQHQDLMGHTALKYAEEYNQKEIAKLIRGYKLD
jgi:ankyrin repeat protein